MTSESVGKVRQQDYVVFFEILSNTKKNTKQQKLVKTIKVCLKIP